MRRSNIYSILYQLDGRFWILELNQMMVDALSFNLVMLLGIRYGCWMEVCI